jgi:hypothetical protein
MHKHDVLSGHEPQPVALRHGSDEERNFRQRQLCADADAGRRRTADRRSASSQQGFHFVFYFLDIEISYNRNENIVKLTRILSSRLEPTFCSGKACDYLNGDAVRASAAVFWIATGDLCCT